MITADPIRVTLPMVTESSVPYPDTGETAWSAATTYALGATVSYQINGVWHRFESKQAANNNKIPVAYPADTENAWWIDLGWVNKIAAFQRDRNTQTIAASPYTVTVDPNLRFGAIGIGNVVADNVTVQVYDSADNLVHTETKGLKIRSIFDWFSWLYEPFHQVTGTVITNIPINATYTFKLTFLNGAGSVKVGAIIPGVPVDIGRALLGTGVKRMNFSLFERDEFGETKITVRRSIPKANYSLLIDKWKLNSVVRLLDNLNGVVTFYAGIVETEDGYFDSVFMIGLYKEFSYQLNLPRHVHAEIEIEAL